MNKKYSLVLVAFLCFVLSGFGQYTGTGSFNRISSNAELTDGYYVIAFGSTYAMNNSHTGTYLDRTVITPAGTTINNPSSAIVWKIETNGTGRTIFNEVSAKYVSYTGSSNNVQIVDNVTTNNQRWNINYSGGLFVFSNLAMTARDLQYNSGAPRFACYTGSQEDLTLYKMTVTGPTLGASPTSISGLNYALGAGPSASQFFDVTGNLLVAGTTVSSNSTNFQVSLSSGTGYAASVNVPPGTLNGTTRIYTRLVAGLGAGNYNSTISVTNATPGVSSTPTINVSGTVTPPAPANDLCNNAVPLIIGAAATNGTLTQATPTSGLGQQSTKNDVWYSFTPSCTGSYTISTTFANDGADIDLYIYTNCPTSGNALFLSNSGNDTDETYVGNFTSGTTYFVRVLDYYTDASAFNIGVSATTPLISTQPANVSVATPTTASFNVASSTAGVSNQWQVSTNGGTTWNNVSTGTGGTTNSYTTAATSLAMNNYQYRCVVTNCGVSTNSNPATLTVFTIADVVITEIMYDSSGTDDEWIEICNVSGSTQNLSNYSIAFQSSTLFTFPAGTTIPNGVCITVSVGSNGDGTFNNICPFTPTYGISASTNNSNNLTNGSGPYYVRLYAPNGTTVVDSVSYGSGDGGNGNDATLHVIDPNIDNSDAGNSNWQEVVNGGSPNSLSLISPCTPIVPEIDIERDNGVSITNGSAPNPVFNTIYGTVDLGDTSAKTFYVRNEGFANLTVSSMTSDNNTEFELIGLPTFPAVLAPGEFIMFDIEFSPNTTAPATRTSIIRVNNNDSNESAYTFNVVGTAGCPLLSGTLLPSSGPIGTEITITSSSNLNGATATLNSVPLTVISSSTGELIVQIPATVTTGGALIVQLSNGCKFTNSFMLIDEAITGCEGTTGTPPSEIFISQVTDSGDDSFTYIELYNGTGSTVNINNYNIVIYNNGRSTPVNSNYTIDLNNVNLTNGSTYVLAIGTNNMDCEPEHNIPTLADQQYNVAGVSINFSKDDINSIGHDHIRLYNSSNHIDSWGVYEDDGWATALNLGGKGANFMRRTDVTAPTTLYNNNDWIVQDWGNNCSDLDYSDIGSFDFSAGTPPSVSLPIIASTCSNTTITVTGAEGYNAGGDTQELTYQWFYLQPATATWTEILAQNADFSGQQNNELTVLEPIQYDGYQFYAQVRENDVTCYIASNAVKLNLTKTVWSSGAWSNGLPSNSKIVVLNDHYTTSAATGSFTACSLVVNPGYLLSITDGYFVEVINSTLVNGDAVDVGSIVVENKGAFVQRGDDANAGTFTLNNTGTSSVNKSTALKQKWYDYTYWSSPVSNETVESALNTAPAARRFYFDASQYEDTDSNDIDDNGDDWQIATGTMTPGVGYAATSNTLGMPFPRIDAAIFSGAFNTGNIPVTIHTNAVATDNDWNFIGNPYPSAIDFKLVYSQNSSIIDGAAYVWSQASPPLASNPGNQNINFNANDYAIISAGSGNTAGGNSGMPSDFIPSGQGFFIKGINAGGTLTFKNSMRMADGSSNSIIL